MSERRIHFFSEDITYDLPDPDATRNWITEVISKHHYVTGYISYIFCSDQYLHQMNMEYLNHDTYTDIITFDNSQDEYHIEGDIFISIDRVRENSKTFDTGELNELRRVMIHGILHLIGYEDHTPEEKEIMRKKEQESLALFKA